MAKEYLIYRITISVNGDVKTANNSGKVDKIAEELYERVDEVTADIESLYGVDISLEEE